MKAIPICLSISMLAFGCPLTHAREAAEAEINAIEIASGVYLLEGSGGNMVAVTGADGILLVDSGFEEGGDLLAEAVARLGSGPVRFLVNTHFHFDHVGGNEHLADSGAVIIAHQTARQRMLAEWHVPDGLGMEMPVIPPYPEAALPTLTFKASTTVHLDGQPIEIIKLPDGHTDADVAVFLREANVLHTGDVFFSNSFPIVDSFHGGSIDGLITEVGALIDLADDDTIVVPGHGPLSNRLGLREYRERLQAGRDRIATLIAEGKSLDETVAANPTDGLYPHGESWLPPEWFVRLVYVDLAQK